MRDCPVVVEIGQAHVIGRRAATVNGPDSEFQYNTWVLAGGRPGGSVGWAGLLHFMMDLGDARRRGGVGRMCACAYATGTSSSRASEQG